MKCYNYDDNGRFSGEGEADESPLQPGMFLLPANATFTEPPAVDEGQAAFWVGDEWMIKILDDLVPLEDRLAQAPNGMFGGPTLGELYAG